MLDNAMLGRPPHFFNTTLVNVMGNALEEAGYHFQGYQIFTEHGLFRYSKNLHETVSVYVVFQFLAYPGGPSRFRVNLMRRQNVEGRISNLYEEITLSRLLWETLGIRRLGSPEFWWTFTSQADLADALTEAGKLIFEYGIPWLEGRRTDAKNL